MRYTLFFVGIMACVCHVLPLNASSKCRIDDLTGREIRGNILCLHGMKGEPVANLLTAEERCKKIAVNGLRLADTLFAIGLDKWNNAKIKKTKLEAELKEKKRLEKIAGEIYDTCFNSTKDFNKTQLQKLYENVKKLYEYEKKLYENCTIECSDKALNTENKLCFIDRATFSRILYLIADCVYPKGSEEIPLLHYNITQALYELPSDKPNDKKKRSGFKKKNLTEEIKVNSVK